MSTAFFRVSFRHLAAHRLRTGLTILGVAFGVAAMVGIRLVNDSASRAFERAVDRVAGKAVLEITRDGPGVAEELIEEVRAVEGVTVVAPMVFGFVPTEGLGGERLLILGIDLLADGELREYQSGASETAVEDPLVFLAQPDSVALTDEFVKKHRLSLEDPVRVGGAGGGMTLILRAILDVKSGPATVLGGRLAVMDVFAAQRVFALDRRLSRIDVGAAHDTDLRALEERVRAVVGDRGRVTRPEARSEAFERLLEGNRLVFTFGGFLALIVGLYLILNTMVIAVAQRSREIGVLRALGLRRGQVARWVLAEAVVLAALGAVVGVPLGVAFARVLVDAYVSSVSSRIMPVPGAEIALESAAILWGVVPGVAAALLAAYLPAREAARVAPAAALRPLGATDERGTRYPRATAAGLVCLVAIAVLELVPAGTRLDPAISQLGLLVAISLLAPASVRLVALAIDRIVGLAAAPLLVLASRGLVATLHRVAVTGAALMIGLAGALSIASLISSLERSVDRVMDSVWGATDLAIGSATSINAHDWSPLAGGFREDVASIPGVARVAAEMWQPLTLDGLPTNLVAQDADVYRGGFRKLDLTEGDPETAFREMSSGRGVLVSEVFANRFQRHLGDALELTTPAGSITLPVVGVSFDLLDLGIAFIDRDFFRRQWGDERVSFVMAILDPAADRAAVADEIRRRFGERHGLFVSTQEELRRENDQVMRESVAAGYPLIAIVLAISLLGVVNSLFASVLDRVREIGCLRAVGALRRQVWRWIVLEAAVIGLAGGIVGVLAGSVIGFLVVGSIYKEMFGFTALFRYPAAAAGFAFVASIVLAALAGALPGRAAARLPIRKALEFE